jgi:hypothetical protein
MVLAADKQNKRRAAVIGCLPYCGRYLGIFSYLLFCREVIRVADAGFPAKTADLVMPF